MGNAFTIKGVLFIRFKNLTGHDPYPHQIATFEALSRGESVILRAPTGSVKSEAVSN
ncbi:MAG: hypothetical protein QMC83_05565 [Thermodesulfovibrionales bacterium]|nr:hypothetical protein [Thermodesulfovibrionales bacterium]